MEKITKKNFKKNYLILSKKKVKKNLIQLVMEIGKEKEDALIFNYFLFKRLSTKLSTTLGSARVETSPN